MNMNEDFIKYNDKSDFIEAIKKKYKNENIHRCLNITYQYEDENLIIHLYHKDKDNLCHIEIITLNSNIAYKILNLLNNNYNFNHLSGLLYEQIYMIILNISEDLFHKFKEDISKNIPELVLLNERYCVNKNLFKNNGNVDYNKVHNYAQKLMKENKFDGCIIEEN